MMDLPSVFREAVIDGDNGATVIECRLIRKLLQNRHMWSRQGLLEGARLIHRSSSMANLRNLADRLECSLDLALIERRIIGRLHSLENLPRLLADAGYDLVRSRRLIVTISRSSAVEAVLAGAHNHGWNGRVVVLDGTASGCGTAQAKRLDDVGIKVRSLPDGAMLECLGQATEESLVLIGADAVGPHRVINAQGTRVLLEMATHRRIDRAFVADSGKDVGEGVIDDLVEAGRLHEDEGPGRRWPVFEAFSRGLAGVRISEVELSVTAGIRTPMSSSPTKTP